MKKHIFYSLSLFLLLNACSDKQDPYVEMPVEQLYNQAMDKFEAKEYLKAAKAFAQVEQQHPYSEWSTRALLLSAYSYFRAKKYEEAIEAYNVFIQLHPGHPEVGYAYYMIGLSYYEQVPLIERDQKVTEQGIEAFKEVLRRFPDADYAKDAKVKIGLLNDHLAAKEMTVGRFYQSQANHAAAVNRFKFVVDTYQTSAHTPEALYRLTESYLALGLTDQAKASAAVLGHNFAGSEWYKDAYELVYKYAPNLIVENQKLESQNKK